MSTSRSGRPVRPPGVYVDMVDRVPVGDRTPDLMTGVPAFIGYADPEPIVLERGRMPAVVLERWNAGEFNRWIKPDDDSFLPMAVRGFFANGGKRCVVLPVRPGSGTEGLMRVLQPGGLLEERTDIDLICVPDALSRLVHDGGSPRDGDDPYQIHTAALAHCEAMGDRFTILDAQDVSSHDEQAIERAESQLEIEPVL